MSRSDPKKNQFVTIATYSGNRTVRLSLKNKNPTDNLLWLTSAHYRNENKLLLIRCGEFKEKYDAFLTEQAWWRTFQNLLTPPENFGNFHALSFFFFVLAIVITPIHFGILTAILLPIAAAFILCPAPGNLICWDVNFERHKKEAHQDFIRNKARQLASLIRKKPALTVLDLQSFNVIAHRSQRLQELTDQQKAVAQNNLELEGKVELKNLLKEHQKETNALREEFLKIILNGARYRKNPITVLFHHDIVDADQKRMNRKPSIIEKINSPQKRTPEKIQRHFIQDQVKQEIKKHMKSLLKDITNEEHELIPDLLYKGKKVTQTREQAREEIEASRGKALDAERGSHLYRRERSWVQYQALLGLKKQLKQAAAGDATQTISVFINDWRQKKSTVKAMTTARGYGIFNSRRATLGDRLLEIAESAELRVPGP